MKNALLILRIGIAFSFFYAGIMALINPVAWIGFFPEFLQNESLLLAHSVFDIVLGLWIVSGWKTFYSASLSAIVMFGIVIFNLGAMDIVFRDVSILLASVSLALLSR